MDTETRAAFKRIDHWFELSQAQYNGLRQELGSRLDGVEREVSGLRKEVGGLQQELGGRLDSVEQEVGGLRQEFHRFRDWATERFAEIRLALEDLTRRIDRLERRQDGPFG